MSEPVILVPLDGSEQALAALPVAKVLGEIERAALHVLHVGERESSEAQLRNRLAHGTPVLDGLTIETRVGTPPAQILQVARELKPLLIVMCKHRHADPGKLLGSTAMAVLHAASCPVVLVPPERGTTPWHLHHVLLPHDGTPRTSAALPPAAQLADRAHAELLVAHVTDGGTAPAELGSLTAPRYVDQPQHEWPAWSSEFLNRLACICPLGHLHVRISLTHGDPAAEVLRLSEKQSTDLIVLAWRGRWDEPHAAIVKDVLGDARCPTMVVRG
jgi:nucleotide-binding universal stress UspA family protein